MNTNVEIIETVNNKLNKVKMNEILANAASQQVAVNRAEEQEEKTNLRVIKIKPAGNAKMFRTLTKAIAAGATTLIVTTRVDVAGCGYVWFGIRKGYTELDGKLLLNAQIWNYLLAFLMGKELPEVTEFEPDREICCQSESPASATGIPRPSITTMRGAEDIRRPRLRPRPPGVPCRIPGNKPDRRHKWRGFHCARSATEI